MGQQLEQLLQRCTVKLSIPDKKGWGTGFFVAPGLILTCHHVVKDASHGSIDICWQNQENFAEATIERSLPEFDLALLRFSPPVANLPCVYLDESFQAHDSLYTYGYDEDFFQGASVTAKCEGIATDNQQFIKFKAGQVRPGLSGSPLLNQRTDKVCGIVKFTRDRSFDLGGGAVPTREILSQFPELKELQQAFHRRDDRWTKLLPRPLFETRFSRQEYRNRQALLNKVNQDWVKGVLERSLHNQIMIELGLEERPDAVDQPWNMVLQTPDEKPTPLTQGTKVIDLFDEIGEGRTLLILGEPGAGKTTTLLELTRNLIARAEQNVDHLIPVVVNLSSWAVKRQKIEDWLAEELENKYQVSKKYGRAFVNEDKLLLLLDGLDEVQAEYQEQCITALNQFHQEYCPDIVVCSRIKDYKQLSNRLNFQSAVYLRGLTLEQIRHYLNSLGYKVNGLRTLVEDDNALQELAQSPLMLNIMTLTYQGVAVEDLLRTDVLEERRKQLFDDYIKRMLSYERIFGYQASSKNKQRYSKTETISWLIGLAQKMVQESQTMFLIEQIQPSWLSSLRQKWSYQLGVLLLVSLIVWFALSLINYTLEFFPKGLIFTEVEKIFDTQIPFYSLVTNYDYLIFKIGFGLFAGLVIGLRQTIKPIETLKFSVVEAWRGTIRGLRKWSIVGLNLTYFGLIAGLLVGLIYILSPNLLTKLSSDELGNWSRVGQIAGAFSGLIAAVTAGLIARPGVQLTNWHSRPLSLRLRVALISGLFFVLSLSFSFSWFSILVLSSGLSVAIIVGLSNGLRDQLVFKLVNTLIVSLSVGLIVSLGNGLSTWLVGGLLYNWKPDGEMLAWIKLWLSGGLGLGATAGLLTGLIARLRSKTNQVETLQGAEEIRNWLILRLRQGLIVGVILALILGLFLSLFTKLNHIGIFLFLIGCLQIGLISTLAFSALFSLAGAFLGILFFAVWGALIGMISGGLTGPDLKIKTTPNQGIRQSALNVVVFALIGGLTIGTIWGVINFLPAMLMTGLVPTGSDWLSSGLTYVMYSGLFCSLIPGAACLQHLTLRFILWKNKFIPWNYACFLDYATERIFLQKVGGGYIFIHRMLMEHFAQMALEE